MLEFVGGLVVGGGVILAVYRFHVTPRWKAALDAAKRDYERVRDGFKARV